MRTIARHPDVEPLRYEIVAWMSYTRLWEVEGMSEQQHLEARTIASNLVRCRQERMMEIGMGGIPVVHRRARANVRGVPP